MKSILSTSLLIAALLSGLDAAAALPDPTKPYARVEDTEIELDSFSDRKVKWKLKGIHISEDYRRAILNGKLVEVGDQIDGAKVLEIRETEVLILNRGKKLVVKLLISNVKKPAKRVEY